MDLNGGFIDALIGAIAILAPAVIAAFVWFGRVDGAVRHLEEKVAALESSQSKGIQDALNEVKALRTDILGVAQRLATSREEALTRFVTTDDMRRLETKVDELRNDLGARIHRAPGV